MGVCSLRQAAQPLTEQQFVLINWNVPTKSYRAAIVRACESNKLDRINWHRDGLASWSAPDDKGQNLLEYDF